MNRDTINGLLIVADFLIVIIAIIIMRSAPDNKIVTIAAVLLIVSVQGLIMEYRIRRK